MVDPQLRHGAASDGLHRTKITHRYAAPGAPALDYSRRVILTVSTVKDSLANVERFVRGNLSGGADHMIVFLDSPSASLEGWLADQPDVTVVVTDKTWWRAARPRGLNRRQQINANLAKAVLTTCPWAQWLFHVDADEFVRIERAALDAVPAGDRAVRLLPLEVVSRHHWDGEPNLFKRLLTDPELELLCALGALAEPSNAVYFRSHAVGKVGVRPALDVRMHIHRVIDRRGQDIPAAGGPGLRMLHLESYSGEEFVRKWTAMLGSGPSVNFGPDRMRLATAMQELLARDLPEETVRRYLMEIYDRHMADPLETLGELGLLEQMSPRDGGQTPRSLNETHRSQLRTTLAALRGEDKALFLPDEVPAKQAAAALARATRG